MALGRIPQAAHCLGVRPAAIVPAWNASRASRLQHHTQASPSILNKWPSSGLFPGHSCSSSCSSFGSHIGKPQGRQAGTTTKALPGAWEAFINSPQRDAIWVAVVAVSAALWVKLFDLLTYKGILDQKLSRKLVHTTSGPLFVVTWPLFRLMAVGFGIVKDDGLVSSVSRTNDRTELLKGPLYYCIVLITMTVLCWRENPAGLIAISLMCGGDGLADIVGRRWGSVKLPYNPSKSYAGSLAMFVGGAAMSIGMMTLFCNLGFFECLSLNMLLPYVLSICLAATIVESLPINQFFDDNLSVPGIAALLGVLLLPTL